MRFPLLSRMLWLRFWWRLLAVGVILFGCAGHAHAAQPATDGRQLDDGHGKRRVWMRDHRIRVRALGALFSVQEEIRLQGGWDAKEYRYRFTLPKGAVVTGFKVEREGRWSTGRVLDARRADREYEDLSGLPKEPDPGLVTLVGPNQYLIRAWPAQAGRPVRVLVSWAGATAIQEGHRILVLPASPRDRRLVAAKVLVLGKGATWRTQKLGRPLSLDLGPVQGRPPLSLQVARTRGGMQACGPKDSRGLLVSLAGLRSAHGTPEVRLVFLVDRSRSMWPGSAKQASALLTSLGRRLGSRGRLALLAFDRSVVRFSSGWVRPTSSRLRRAGRWLAQAGGGNGTDLTQALLEAQRLFASAPKGRAVRRLLVLFTDGLLPESFSPQRAAGFLQGVEVVALVGSAGSGSMMALSDGPVAQLVRLRGGIGWAFDPSGFGRRCPACPRGRMAEAILGSEPITGISLQLDGRSVSRLPSALTTVTGVVAGFWWSGPAAAASVRFSHRGRWVTRAVKPRPLRPDASVLLKKYVAARSVRGLLTNPPATEKERQALVARALACAKVAGIVTPVSALVALDMAQPFSRDRWRFVFRWGDRFFSRIGTGGTLPARPSIWSHRVRVGASGRSLSGSLTKRMVLRRIRRGFVRKARRCYESVLDAGGRPDATLQGRIVLRLELARGEVVDVHIERPEFAHRKLFECLTNAAFSLRIPYSRADRTLYQVIYPMRFRLDDRSVQILKSAAYVPREVRSGDPLEDME